MARLPRLTAGEMVTVLEKIGFRFSRQSGSHKIYKSDLKKRATVPFHGSKVLHPKIIKSILKDAELTAEELQKLL